MENKFSNDEAELFNIFKKDVNDLIANNWEGVDQEIIPHLKLINEIPGMVTRFSCASHPEKDKNQFYIMLPHNPETVSFADELLDKMFFKYSDLCHYVDYNFYINYSQVTRCATFVNYKTIFIEARLDEETKTVFLELLLKTISDLKNEILLEAAKLGTFPSDFNQWEIKNVMGWTVAHEAALYGNLPPDFNQWELKDNEGTTVLEVHQKSRKV